MSDTNNAIQEIERIQYPSIITQDCSHILIHAKIKSNPIIIQIAGNKAT
jgi:hypothetical protein